MKLFLSLFCLLCLFCGVFRYWNPALTSQGKSSLSEKNTVDKVRSASETSPMPTADAQCQDYHAMSGLVCTREVAALFPNPVGISIHRQTHHRASCLVSFPCRGRLWVAFRVRKEQRNDVLR